MSIVASLKKRIVFNKNGIAIDSLLVQIKQLQKQLLQQSENNECLKEPLQARDQELAIFKRLRIKELEGQLAKNSNNSSKPPQVMGFTVLDLQTALANKIFGWLK